MTIVDATSETDAERAVLDAKALELQADLDARSTRRLYADGRGPGTVAEAYALQRALRRIREARGETVAGFKIGYTSPSVRRNSASVMGLHHSVHGYLWDSEAHANGATIDHRRLGIEGELGVTLLSTDGPDVSRWEVEYEPIIEIHMMGMDGPPADNNGRRGLELIGTNCIHAGVVHCDGKRRALLGDVALDAPMTVDIGGQQIEQVTMTELQVDGVYGPVGTVGWLLRTLQAEGHGDDALIQPGAVLICSTPGGLYPVPPGTGVRVEFDGLVTTCIADTSGEDHRQG